MEGTIIVSSCLENVTVRDGNGLPETCKENYTKVKCPTLKTKTKRKVYITFKSMTLIA
jgi:hypothetical protein